MGVQHICRAIVVLEQAEVSNPRVGTSIAGVSARIPPSKACASVGVYSFERSKWRLRGRHRVGVVRDKIVPENPKLSLVIEECAWRKERGVRRACALWQHIAVCCPRLQIWRGVEIHRRVRLEATATGGSNWDAVAPSAAVETRELAAAIVASSKPVVRAILLHNLTVMCVDNLAISIHAWLHIREAALSIMSCLGYLWIVALLCWGRRCAPSSCTGHSDLTQHRNRLCRTFFRKN